MNKGRQTKRPYTSPAGAFLKERLKKTKKQKSISRKELDCFSTFPPITEVERVIVCTHSLRAGSLKEEIAVTPPSITSADHSLPNSCEPKLHTSTDKNERDQAEANWKQTKKQASAKKNLLASLAPPPSLAGEP